MGKLWGQPTQPMPLFARLLTAFRRICDAPSVTKVTQMLRSHRHKKRNQRREEKRVLLSLPPWHSRSPASARSQRGLRRSFFRRPRARKRALHPRIATPLRAIRNLHLHAPGLSTGNIRKPVLLAGFSYCLIVKKCYKFGQGAADIPRREIGPCHGRFSPEASCRSLSRS